MHKNCWWSVFSIDYGLVTSLSSAHNSVHLDCVMYLLGVISNSAIRSEGLPASVVDFTRSESSLDLVAFEGLEVTLVIGIWLYLLSRLNRVPNRRVLAARGLLLFLDLLGLRCSR